MSRFVAAYLDANHTWAPLSPIVDSGVKLLDYLIEKMRDVSGQWNELATGMIRVWEFADVLDEETPTFLMEWTFVEGQCTLIYEREHLPEWRDPIKERILVLLRKKKEARE